jgi:hypothetical protein
MSEVGSEDGFFLREMFNILALKSSRRGTLACRDGSTKLKSNQAAQSTCPFRFYGMVV